MFFTLCLVTQLAFQKHEMFSHRSEENDSCVSADKAKAQIVTRTTCETLLQIHSYFYAAVFLPVLNDYHNDISPFVSYCQKKEGKKKPLEPSPTTLPQKNKNSPNHKVATPTNNKGNLTVMLGVIFRIRQCGLSFLI